MLVKLQARQLSVHAHEISKLWQQLDEEREIRAKLQEVSSVKVLKSYIPDPHTTERLPSILVASLKIKCPNIKGKLPNYEM